MGICYCGEFVRSPTDVCRHGTSVITSLRDCDGSHLDWWMAEPSELRGLDRHEVAQEALTGVWPMLAYYGPVNLSTIAEACPILRQGGYVYHLLDAWRSVLYIGKSKKVSGRIRSHNQKYWWKEVHTVRIFSIRDYHSLETADIEHLVPRYNINGSSARAFVADMRRIAEDAGYFGAVISEGQTYG